MHREVLLVLGLVLCAFALPAVPGIQKVNFKVGSLESVWYRSVQYTDEDSPRGGNKTYVQVSLLVSRDDTSNLADAINFQWVYNWHDRDWARFVSEDNIQPWCLDLSSKAVARHVGGPTYQNGSVLLPSGQESIALDLLFWTTEKSGPYYFTIYNCNSGHALRVRGTFYMRNPYGWLNGEDWPSAALYGLFMCLFIIFSLVFGLFLYRNREFAHPYQVIILVLLVLSWIFLGISFIVYMTINSRGRISTGVLVIEALISATRETAIRLLLLAISLGYTVIFPVIGGRFFKIAIVFYSSLYWLFYFLNTLLTSILINTDSSLSDGGYTFVAVFQIILEVVWWFWIFYNTVVVGRILKAAGLPYVEKYKIYRILFWMMLILGFFVIISYVVYAIGGYTDKLDDWWKNYWYFDFYGEIAFLVVMLVLMTSWRPGRDPNKYSYQPLVLGARPQSPPPAATGNAPSAPAPLPNREPASL